MVGDAHPASTGKAAGLRPLQLGSIGFILMPSPFPGMNPWVEQDGLWPDFHVAFVPALRRQLAHQVVPRYIVLMEEQIYIHELPPGPVEDIERVPFLEIRDRQSRELVTVIELLSPSNKRRGD